MPIQSSFTSERLAPKPITNNIDIRETLLPSITTSGESLRKSRRLAVGLRQQILVLARRAGVEGITISEAERLIQDHKGHSISPRFAELIKSGDLVRIPASPGRPSKRFPFGIPRHITRYDEHSQRYVNIHWIPEFAPRRTKAVEYNEEGGVR